MDIEKINRLAEKALSAPEPDPTPAAPQAQATFEGIVMDIKSSKDDVKTLGSVMQSFDEQLEQVAVRGEQIDNATQQLGVDPSSVSEADDLHMETEMREMMGDEAPTPADRGRVLREKFGVVSTIAGRDGKFDKDKQGETQE